MWWTDPTTHRIMRMFGSQEAADAWVADMQATSRTGVDPGQRLSEYVALIGDRWERDYGRSTVKNTIAPLVLVLDEAVRDGLITRNPANDRARRSNVRRSFGNVDSGPSSPRDLALPDVDALDRLVAGVVESGGHQCWGDMVTILATTAMRISEVSGLQVGDVDLKRGVIHVSRQTYPGRGGLVTKTTKGRRRRTVPIIDPLRSTMERLTADRPADEVLLAGPRGGIITTATMRDATHGDELVTQLGYAGLVRHGLRHTALTWMADAGVPLHVLQRVAGHQDPAVTTGYLHPDVQAMLDAGAGVLGLVVPQLVPSRGLDVWSTLLPWGGSRVCDLRVCRDVRLVGLTGFEPATP